MASEFGVNQGLVEEMYLRYRENPASVDESWRNFFENGSPDVSITPSLRPAPAARPVSRGNGNGQGVGQSVGQNAAQGALDVLDQTLASLPTSMHLSHWKDSVRDENSFEDTKEVRIAHELQGRVSALINAYRVRGHLYADLDPLGLLPQPPNELSLERFGLSESDLSTSFSTQMAGAGRLTLREILQRLNDTYCRSIGVEFTSIEDPIMRAWLQERMEVTCNRIELDAATKLRILSKLTDAEVFEQFLHTNYVGAKRFSLEGGESTIPLLELIVEESAKLGVEEIVIGMAHRGRLNVLANVMEKSLRELFWFFEDTNPEVNRGRGDVKYHLGYSSDRVTPSGHTMHLTLSFNPSHLEWVDPVVEGRVRAKQDRRKDRERKKVLPLLIHGDAAFVGQGVVAETLNLSRIEGYTTGGTVHLVINNQIGFTTSTEEGRCTRYATDITRMLRCPVFHVNGEDPEAVAQVVRLASEFRQKFSHDVVIDLYCYRRYGHNEADEPRFTQPIMYAAIDQKPTARQLYAKRLLENGVITEEQANALVETKRQSMEQALKETRAKAFVPPAYTLQGVWKDYQGGKDSDVPHPPTAVPKERLAELLAKLAELPHGFTPNAKVKRLLDERALRASGDKPLDWGTAEALAYATLVTEGKPVRLSGQDSGRGTFSHRHATVVDIQTGQNYTPGAHLSKNQARFEVLNSPLSEAGVLGFDYGYSLDSPEALVLWEAQFGDFVNSAQVIVDQFITSSEDKWHRLSGLVLLLPHGFEGQGPEHSSARLERFMSACAEDNIQVCNLTTSAQIFHCLRRQVVRPFRKPLVIMSPKSLLRLPLAASPLEDLATGSFQRIIRDHLVEAKAVKRVLLCSGKVYYDLAQARETQKLKNVAILRLEQLYPLHASEVQEVLGVYKKGTELVWVQEEPANMGAWPFLALRLPAMLEGRMPLGSVTRPERASPATGSLSSHKMEQADLIRTAFEGV